MTRAEQDALYTRGYREGARDAVNLVGRHLGKRGLLSLGISTILKAVLLAIEEINDVRD
ncbi:MAG: hypothetical protein KGI71_04670 [Patescibacteria group bacterium]|nr:hypothetical protein [Patescibacteria group bacterium]